jgi:hypothetical protein
MFEQPGDSFGQVRHHGIRRRTKAWMLSPAMGISTTLPSLGFAFSSDLIRPSWAPDLI